MKRKSPIIIVEDDPDDQMIYQEILEGLGISNKVICFDDCEKAFQYLMTTEETPFIILSDINMPRVNGVDFKKKIDSTDYLRFKSIPFVFITTSDDERMILEAYQKNSIQGYFKKAASMEEMKRKLSTIISYWQESLTPT